MEKKKITIIMIVLIMLFIAVYFIYINKDNKKENKVCIKNKCIQVEVADNTFLREKGLMYRTSLCDDCGMLFIFPAEGKYGFWMKNTKIPLDIIWISKDKKIVNIIKAEPCVNEICQGYYPEKDSLYVLEVNSGFSRENQLKLGDDVRIDVKRT